jgi:hypothetical protein
MGKLKAPENSGGINIAGVEYKANRNGVITIPDEHVGLALTHGYTEFAGKEKAELAPADAAGEPLTTGGAQ